MSRFILSSLGFGLVSLIVACNGSEECADCPTNEAVGHDNDTADDTDDPCADCPDDSGDTDDTGTPTGSAMVLYNAYIMSTKLTDAPINAGSVTGTSGTSFEVPAPADYTVMVGDSAKTSLFGFPVYTASDGEYWAAPNDSVSVVDGDSIDDGRFDLFNLFEPGVYECTYDKYEYDASAADLKGDFQRTVELDPQTISVNHDGQVEPQDNPDMDVVGDDDGDYIKVENDHLVLQQVGDGETYITDSEIGKNFFSLTSISPSGFTYVADLRCDLEP